MVEAQAFLDPASLGDPNDASSSLSLKNEI